MATFEMTSSGSLKHRAFRCANIWIAIAACLMMTGCAARYHEPARGEGAATIEAVAPVWIISIDGKSVGHVSITGVQAFAVSPGNHIFELKYAGTEQREFETWRGEPRDVRLTRMSRKNLQLSARMEPEHHYYAHAGAYGGMWKPYINEAAPNTFLELPVQ